MVESNIERKLNNRVDSALDYISIWAKQRLDEWRADARSPVITKISNGFQIGYVKVIKQNDRWISSSISSDDHSVYINKNVAVIHTLFEFTGHRRIADDILRHNDRICKLTDDLVHYRNGKSRALKKDNYDLADVIDARINLAQSQIDSSWFQLQKTLELTKYIKIWKD
jgi:hypothetical protein